MQSSQQAGRAMSQENVALTYNAVDAFNRRDIDAILALSHPDVEHVALGGEKYRGRDDVRAWWEETFSGIGDVVVEVQGVRDFGDTVLLAVRLRGHGTSSRVPFDQTIWTVHKWSDGQMVQWTSHLHEPEALEAAGLSGSGRMSRENVEVVPGQTDRDLLDRVQARVPALSGLLLVGVRRMRQDSQLRRRLVNWSVKRGFAAMNRSDVDLVVLFYEPDAEVRMSGMAGVGISERYVGHEGIRELYADLDAAFSDWSYAIRAVADLVDRLAVRADFLGYGRSSGAETTLNDVGMLVELSAGGKIARQEWMVEQNGWRRVLEAVGLSE